MDGRIYFPTSEDISKEIKVNLSEEERKQTLVIARDTKNILELEYIPSLHFKDLVKEEILAGITILTESKLSGWTHEEQKSYLNKVISSLKIENEILKNALADKIIKPVLLDLMLYGKYILQYRKAGNNHENELYYINQFKSKLAFLIDKMPEVKQLIHVLSERDDFLRILPLAYHEIIANDAILSEFRASEIVGHNAAYAVARNSNIKDLIIVDKQGAILEKYSLNQIKVMKNKSRDLALKGLILIPDDNKAEEIPTVYITWAGTHSTESRNADLERAPGEESYRCGEDQIVSQIINCIKSLNRPVKLVICGHSLGGSLSQLSFHSLQRILALNIKDEETHTRVLELEEAFCNDLSRLSPHQRDLSKIKINPNLIREMSVDIWNSAGVLQPVIRHSNELCSILVNNHIPQVGNIGVVYGDVVHSFGQGCILNDVPINGAKIKLLKIQPVAAGSLLAALGIPTAFPAGLSLFGVNAIGLLASFFCLGVILVKVVSEKSYAHRKHHFKNGTRPEDAYIVYKSHFPNDVPNEAHCKIIYKELSTRSYEFFDTGIQFISDSLMQEERFQSELQKAFESSQNDKILNFLISHINNSADELRIINLIIEKHISNIINIPDKNGKTLLHHALQFGKFNIAAALLEVEGIDVNLIDNEKNYPMLIFMQQLNNAYLPFAQLIYKLGVKLLDKTTIDLTVTNTKAESVEKIYKKWYWSGSYAKPLMLELAKRLKPLAEKKQEEIKVPTLI